MDLFTLKPLKGVSLRLLPATFIFFFNFLGLLNISKAQAPTCSLEVSFTPIACFGGTSTITANIQGATSVTYTLQPSNISNTTGIFPNLTGGNYIVEAINNDNGCTTSSVVVIPQPSSLLQASSTIQHITCFGMGNGAVNLSVTGGVSPYTYEWSASGGGIIPPGQMTNQDLIQVFAGNYSVIITDAAGCSVQHNVTVNQPGQLLASATTTNVICWGAASGSVNLTVTGGTTPYTFEWTGSWGGVVPAGQENQEDLTGLTGGFYEVIIRDANNCITSKSVIIQAPSIGLATSYTQTNISCFGNATGAIDLNVSNGVAPYTYNWVASAGGIIPAGQQTLQDINNLVAGTYTCTVTDNIGCTTVRQITLTQPATGLSLAISQNNNTCFGGSQGAINLTVSGSNGTLQYSWLASAGGQIPAGQENIEDLSGLTAGVYTVNVSDGTGCTASQTITIAQPSNFGISYAVTNVNCAGNANGSINLTVTGGTAPYSFTWIASNGGVIPSGQLNIEDLSNLVAGTYTVAIQDANGCIYNTAPGAIITSPSVLNASIIHNNVTVCNTATGSIDLTVSGGTAPYSYSWAASAGGIIPTGQQTNQDLTSVMAGTYQVTITDNAGCVIVRNVIVSDNCGGPLPCSMTVSETHQNVSCYGYTDGSITISIASGTAPYNISWTASNGGIIPAGQQTGSTLSNLTGGSYSYTVIDGTGCSVSGTVIITAPVAPLAISETHINVICGNGSGSINITVTGGTQPYSYNWVTIFGGSIPSGQQHQEDLSGLVPGIYLVNVTDAEGCRKSRLIVINQTVSNISLSVSTTNAVCSGSATGSINLTINNPVGSYNYLWTASNGGIVPAGQQNNQDLTGLVAGKYHVLVTDANGCTKTKSATIGQAPALNIHFNTTNVQGCNASNGSINLSHGNYGGPFTYVWVGTNGGIVPASQVNNQDLTGLTAGTYTVTVSAQSGCTVTDNVSITQNCNPVNYGCSNGYWKNHTQHWDQMSDVVVMNMPQGLRFTTSTNFYTYFNLTQAVPDLPNNLTMAGAVNLSGGQCRAFARSAVTALLIVASGQSVNYPSGTNSFTSLYNAIRNALINGNCSGSLKNQLGHMCNTFGNNDDDDDDDDDDDGKIQLITSSENPIQVTAFPNPYISDIRFLIRSEVSGNATLELFSLTGEKIAMVYNGPVTKKVDRTVTYNVSPVNRKTLVYVLRIGDKVQSGKVLFLN